MDLHYIKNSYLDTDSVRIKAMVGFFFLFFPWWLLLIAIDLVPLRALSVQACQLLLAGSQCE